MLQRDPIHPPSVHGVNSGYRYPQVGENIEFRDQWALCLQMYSLILLSALTVDRCPWRAEFSGDITLSYTPISTWVFSGAR